MRHYRLIASFLCVTVVLSACTPDAPPDNKTNTPTIITFGAREDDRLLYRPIINTFNQQYEDIQVQFVALDDAVLPNNGSTNQSSLRQVVSAADTAIGFAQPSDVANHYLLDLKPFIDADVTFNVNDYYASALQPIGADSSTYVLPQTLYLPLLGYNKTLWLASGLPEPRTNPTWDELITAAKHLAHRENDKTTVYGLMDNGEALLVLLQELEKNHVNLLTSAPEEVQFDQPNIRAALQQVRELVKIGAVYTYNSEEQPITSFEDIARLVREQRLMIWPTDTIPIDPSDSRLGFDVGYIPFPKLSQPSQLAGQEGYIISAGTQHPEAAWKWLAFLSQQPVGSPALPRVPARKSLVEETGVIKRLPPQIATAVTTALEAQATTVAPIIDERAFLALTNKPLQFVAGKISLAQALQQAQADFEQGTTNKLQPDTAPIVVATPVVIPDSVISLEFTTQFGDQQLLQKLADQFTHDNPAIRVHVRYAGSSNSSDSIPEIAQASDCFMWNAPPRSQEISSTLNLKPMIDADTSFDGKDYPSGVLAPFQHQGGVYGIPLVLQLRALAYNQDLLEQSNVSLPNANWTLDDFLRTAEQVTQPKAKPVRYGYNVASVTPDDIPFFLDRFGASIIQTVDGTIQPDFTNPQVLSALQYYIALSRQSTTPDHLRGYRAGMLVWSDLISTGQTGMWLTFDSSPVTSQTMTTHVVVPPRGTEAMSRSDIYVTGMYIASQTNHRDECWQWLSFLSRSPLQLAANAFPARRSVAQSAAFDKVASEEARTLYAAYLPRLEHASGNTLFDPFNDPTFEPFWFYQAIDKALQGDNLKDALLQAQDVTSQYLACMQNKGTRRPCAKQADIEYQGLAPQ